MSRVRSLLCCTFLLVIHLNSQTAPFTQPNVVPRFGRPLLRTQESPLIARRSAPSLLAFSDTDYAAGEGQAVAVGDFNRDGKQDYVIADYGGSTIQTLLGNGDGTFQPALVSSSQNSQLSIASGDFNGDGILDLVTGSQNGTVAVLLGKGDGSFTAPTLISVSTNGSCYGVAVADLNRDGKQDIVATAYSSNVVVLLGKGDGTFQSPKSFTAATTTLNVAVADLNGDQALDLVVTDTNFLAVLLGNGDGTFQPEHDFNVSTGVSYGVFVSDVNQDGVPDIAATGYQSTGGNVVSLLLGNGDGTFRPFTAFAVGSAPVSVVGADFNADGFIDLATANFAGNSASVLLGNGDGTFQPQLEFKVRNGASAIDFGIAAADFNIDGRPDLVTANETGGSSVLINSLAAITPVNNGFGTHLLGTSSSAPFTLTNVSNAALPISGVTITGTNTADFSQSNDCGSSLPAGASCTISVKFSPTVTGARSASLNVSFSGAGSPQTASLNGYGTVVQLAPSRLDFGQVQVGNVSTPKTVTLTNTGSQGVVIQFTGVAGADKTDFFETTNCPGFLPAGSSCSIKVIFGPSVTGVRNAYLRVVDLGGGPYEFVPLKGTGI